MPKITVLGYGSYNVESGKKLVLALEDNGVNILHHCGGNAKCTTCRVEVLDSDCYDITNIERNAFIEKSLVDDYLRLSCQIRVNCDLTIRPVMTKENSGLPPGPRPAD